MTMLLGVGGALAVTAAMAFLIVHALYKAALFLAVGMIEKGAGSRDYRDVAGLGQAMPLTAAVALLAGLSMAGFPPFFGFVGKEMIYKAAGYAPLAVTVAALAANAMMVACAALVAVRPFLGAAPRAPKDAPADPGWALWLGPSVLAVLGLAFGLVPGVAERLLVRPMTLAVAGAPPPVALALWHGVNAALILSLVTFALGFALYAAIDRIRDALAAGEPSTPGTEAGYDALRTGLDWLAAAVTGRVQDGRMTHYLRRTFIVFAALLWGALLLGDGFSWPTGVRPIGLFDLAVLLIMVASIVGVLRARGRLAAIAALGGVGAGVALVFVLYGAIDVAMTQLFVEILVVVFLAVAMVRMPPLGALGFDARNAAVAAALGLGVAGVTLAVLGTDLDRFMTTYFEETSYPVAHGRNVVNVILVDFRGFDTLGEIAVIVIAGVAAVAALTAGRRARRGAAR
jgi:multicomponent Na+:H+ antiporter subunit A